MKLFSIRVQEVFQTIVLRKSDSFLLILKAFSLDTTKNAKFGKEIGTLRKIDLCRNEMWRAVENHNCRPMSHDVQKLFETNKR